MIEALSYTKDEGYFIYLKKGYVIFHKERMRYKEWTQKKIRRFEQFKQAWGKVKHYKQLVELHQNRPETYDIQNYDLSLEAIYSALRMSLASAFNEHEYISLDDVMAITGESREELLQKIEQCRQELIEAEENPDEYFKPVEPQRAAVYYFPNGLH